MKKTYEVQIDVTMSGNLYIEAETEEEAQRKVMYKNFTPSDLKNFWFVGLDIVEMNFTPSDLKNFWEDE